MSEQVAEYTVKVEYMGFEVQEDAVTTDSLAEELEQLKK